MGALAWLMLVINSLAAAPMGMVEGAHSPAMHATAATIGEHSHPRGSCCDDQGSACGDMAGFTCHCVAACSTALPTAGMAVLTPLATTVRYAVLLPRSAPSLDNAPPLRPPAV